MPDHKKLDNPAWHALTETHTAFALGSAVLKKYDPAIVWFAGYDRSAADIVQQFDTVFEPGDSFFLFDDYPAMPAHYSITAFVECMQMVCEKPVPVSITENIVPLDKTDHEEMYTLVSEVFPGYYLPGTPLMGDYFGIFKAGKLVAMAGERLCMHGLTEISAVVTHPQYQGLKYA